MVSLITTSDLLHIGSSLPLTFDILSTNLQKYFASVSENELHRDKGIDRCNIRSQFVNYKLF